MGNRCEQCGKFVSLEMEEPEVDLELDFEDDHGHITGIITLKLNCAECGSEMKSCELDVEAEFDHEKGHDLELTDTTAEMTDRYQTTKNGKPVPLRYQRHYYDAEITAVITCKTCDKDIDITETVEAQASEFEDAW